MAILRASRFTGDWNSIQVPSMSRCIRVAMALASSAIVALEFLTGGKGGKATDPTTSPGGRDIIGRRRTTPTNSNAVGFAPLPECRVRVGTNQAIALMVSVSVSSLGLAEASSRQDCIKRRGSPCNSPSRPVNSFCI